MQNSDLRKPDPTLEHRRDHERRKYLHLAGKRCLALLGGRYGASNHGRGAVRTVLAWQPRFVTDFGCGNNAFIESLRRRGVQGVGIDFANARADIHAPMHEVPLESGIADVITCFDALEHLLPEDVHPALAEMHRVATAGPGCRRPARFVFSICTRPSRVRVNGENLHPTVRPIEWWLRQIERVGTVSVVGRRYIQGCFDPPNGVELGP